MAAACTGSTAGSSWIRPLASADAFRAVAKRILTLSLFGLLVPVLLVGILRLVDRLIIRIRRVRLIRSIARIISIGLVVVVGIIDLVLEIVERLAALAIHSFARRRVDL